jgi:hypothetical protein
MKTFKKLPYLAILFAAGATVSCRTMIPVDPNTGELSCRCMPQNVTPPGPAGCGPSAVVEATK